MLFSALSRVGVASTLCLVIGPLVAGCGGSTRGGHAATTPVPVPCDSVNIEVDTVVAHPSGDVGDGFDLRLRNRGQLACVLAAPPYVYLDSGYGPSPAIDGTADPDGNLKGPVVLRPGGTLRLLVSWSTGCGANHVAPIVGIKVRVAPSQPELSLPASHVPPDVKPNFCWNDGVELGQTRGQ